VLAISRVVALVAVGVLIDLAVATDGSASTREIIVR